MITLYRICSSDNGTFGVVIENNLPICVTLELPWKDNKRSISCIPNGIYKCKKDKSPSKNKILGGDVIRVLNVPNRDNILWHTGNYVTDSKGCILIGKSYNNNEIASSVEAMRKVLKELPNEFELEIKGV